MSVDIHYKNLSNWRVEQMKAMLCLDAKVPTLINNTFT